MRPAYIITIAFIYWYSQSNLNLTNTLECWIPILLKVTVKFSIEQAMKAQRGSRGTALLFL
jgi:hypothetical protein